jgi:short-subunit dehydrogenase
MSTPPDPQDGPPRPRPVPGWYDDPSSPGRPRWWDGERWAPPGGAPARPDRAPTAPPGTPPHAIDIPQEQAGASRARAFLFVGMVSYALSVVCTVITFDWFLSWYIDFIEETMDAVERNDVAPVPTMPALTGTQTAAQLLSYVASIGSLLAGIIFVVWFYRAMVNARGLGLPARLSPVWAVLGFIIPIISLWFPYWCAKDLFPHGHPGRKLALRWWLTFILGSQLTLFFALGALLIDVSVALAVSLVGACAGRRRAPGPLTRQGGHRAARHDGPAGGPERGRGDGAGRGRRSLGQGRAAHRRSLVRPVTAPPSWPWAGAVVTGASSGIGAAMARRLAAGGVRRLVLVARRGDLLEHLAADLADGGAEPEVLVADLTTTAGCGAVEERLGAGPAIDLLVNDAAATGSGPFAQRGADVHEAVIRLDVLALTRLTHAAVGPMLARGRGAVLNVSSMVTYHPSPGMATYAASKAFVTHLSEALHEELRGTGVTVTAVLPGFTRTAMAAGTRMVPGFAWLTPDAVATAGLEAAARGRALCIPGAPYRAAAAVVTPLPRTARRWIVGRAAGRFSR